MLAKTIGVTVGMREIPSSELGGFYIIVEEKKEKELLLRGSR